MGKQYTYAIIDVLNKMHRFEEHKLFVVITDGIYL